MGNGYNQPPRGQGRTVAKRAPSQAAFDTSYAINQNPISHGGSINRRRTRRQQCGAWEGSRARAAHLRRPHAIQSLSRADKRLLLKRFLSLTLHKANSEPMWNVQGSSRCNCLKVNGESICSWIEVCKIMTGRRVGKCSFDGCYNKATCGGHVKYLDSKTWYLAPICSSCNSTYNDEEARPMRDGTMLVKVKCHCPK